MKKKKKVNVRELVGLYQKNCERIREISDLCEKEKRERNESENAEFEEIVRENQYIQMKMQAAGMENAQIADEAGITDQVRELIRSGRRGQILLALQRETAIMTTEGLEDTGIIPVSQQEMLKPLRAGLIYEKVGINVRTGLSKGQLRWPIHSKATAQWAGEGERLVDSKVDFSALNLMPERLGVAIPVTREELESSEGVVESVIREEMPLSCVEKINEAMFATSDTYEEGGKQVTRKVYGPFVEAAKNPVAFAGAVPTRKELLKMKARVAATGIVLSHPCWVMTESMKAELEDTKVDAGSGRFVCENDTVLGYPVFTTPYIGEGNVGFGDWGYQAAGFFGAINVAADPYTLLRENSMDFVLNAHFGTATLYKEAFVLGQAKA